MDGQLRLALPSKPKPQALSVTQLVRMVRDTLELHLDEIWVVGEISNLRNAASSHLYFTLKDTRSAINVVMFRSAGAKLRFKPADGMQVMVRGRINLFEARGALQLYADEIEPRGAGALQLAYEQLKARLSAEGLFDERRKRPLPFMPRIIGIVTALQGAAIRDMLTTIFARYPNRHIIVRAARVQGAGAAGEIAEAIDDLNRHRRAEVIIVGRGGGSLEDLWAFNEEVVARAIHRSQVPVISAVGHEIDYTIADFVADVRAPTPTAAGQLVVPRRADLQQRIAEITAAMWGALQGELAGHRKHLVHLTSRLRDPRVILRQERQSLGECEMALHTAIRRRLESARRSVAHAMVRLRAPDARLREIKSAVEGSQRALGAAISRRISRDRYRMVELGGRLDSLSPLRVLERGYAVVLNNREGKLVTDAAAVEVGDQLDIRFRRGRLTARAEKHQA